MAELDGSVTMPVQVSLETLAHGLVNTLDGRGLQTFIYQLVALRNEDAWTAELTEELTAPLNQPIIDFPFDVLEAAAKQIHTSYDRSTPIEQHDARQAAREALEAAAARLAVRRG